MILTLSSSRNNTTNSSQRPPSSVKWKPGMTFYSIYNFLRKSTDTVSKRSCITWLRSPVSTRVFCTKKAIKLSMFTWLKMESLTCLKQSLITTIRKSFPTTTWFRKKILISLLWGDNQASGGKVFWRRFILDKYWGIARLFWRNLTTMRAANAQVNRDQFTGLIRMCSLRSFFLLRTKLLKSRSTSMQSIRPNWDTLIILFRNSLKTKSLQEFYLPHNPVIGTSREDTQ